MLKPLKNVITKYLLLKRGWSPQQNLFYGFITYIILGAILLSLPFFQKTSASILDHFFIATSAVSTTGLVTISIFDTYNFLAGIYEAIPGERPMFRIETGEERRVVAADELLVPYYLATFAIPMAFLDYWLQP